MRLSSCKQSQNVFELDNLEKLVVESVEWLSHLICHLRNLQLAEYGRNLITD